MDSFTIAYIALGSNLADRKNSIQKALDLISRTPQISLVQTSTLIETKPLTGAKQPKYLNAVAQVKTLLDPQALHSRLSEIENLLGRTREEKWAPRTIDLDLLLFGRRTSDTPGLTVPHPRMHLRSFVLTGLCEISPQLVHPILNQTMENLLKRLNGADFAPDPELPQLVSIAGVIGVGKTTLTKKLSRLLDCEALFEAYNTNPFLPLVYAGKKELALDSQLYFLTSRIEQLNANSLPKGKITFADYLFDKELIYARRLLNAKQLDLYEKIYQPLRTRVVSPAVAIYLTDSPQRCLDRIRKRNRPYEQKIRLGFLRALSADYQRLFAEWKASPVIRINLSKLDHMENTDIQSFASQIKSYVAI